MKGGRKSRRVSRKAPKGRKGRSASRRSTRRQRGGWVVLNPAALGDNSMVDAGKQSLAQGGEYKQLHAGQYGGGAPLMGAPVGETGVLDSSLRGAAMLGPLDRSLTAIHGMSDQSGGARRKRKASRKGRKTSRRSASRKGRKGGKASRKGRKGRKASRKGRKASRKSLRGGAALHPADFGAPGTLLPADLQSKALATMNPEWKLAENPASFAPKA
jgi:hypothetical protein